MHENPATRPRNKAIGNPIQHVIRTEKEHNEALKEIEGLLDGSPKKGSKEYDRLELLSILVEAPSSLVGEAGCPTSSTKRGNCPSDK